MKLNNFISSCLVVVFLLMIWQCEATMEQKVSTSNSNNTNNSNKNKKSSLFDYNKQLFKVQGNTQLRSSPRFKGKEEASQFFLAGWLRYLEIKEYDLQPPTSFIKNMVYQTELSDNPYISLMSKDQFGYINVPYDDMFYIEMSINELTIYSARDLRYKRVVKIIPFWAIVPQESRHPFKGGIEDVGNFAEGYCFMVKVHQIEKFIVEFCTETVTEKETWMTKLSEKNTIHTSSTYQNSQVNSSPVIYNPNQSITKYTPPSYTNNQYITLTSDEIPPGYVIIGTWSSCSQPCGQGKQTRSLECVNAAICEGKRMQEKLCNIKACKEEVDSHMERLKLVADGKWEYLGNWSPCSKSCGGGTQTIKRKCMSINGCEGEEIVTQPCNTFPCNESNSNGLVITDDSSIFTRNVYDECKLFEGNLTLVINNERVLSHVEVNTQTIQIISKNNPRQPIVLPMNTLTQVRNSFSTPGCFKLFNNNSQFTCLCPDTNQASADVWVSRILEFKNKCTQKLLNDIHNDIYKSIQESNSPNHATRTLNNLQSDLITEGKFHSNLKQKVLESQFEEFKRQAQDLLDKEEEYESRLEQAEKQRIVHDEYKLKEKINQEQAIAQKLLADIQTISVNDSMYKIKEHSIKKEMKDMMNNLQQQIQIRRERLITKLQGMRTMHEINKRKAAQESIETKRKIGKQIALMTRQGNPSQCLINNNPSLRDSYCTAHYSDPDMQSECRNQSQFCYMCCNSEVGTVNQENLNCCYNKCDNLSEQLCANFDQTYQIANQQVIYIK